MSSLELPPELGQKILQALENILPTALAEHTAKGIIRGALARESTMPVYSLPGDGNPGVATRVFADAPVVINDQPLAQKGMLSTLMLSDACEIFPLPCQRLPGGKVAVYKSHPEF